MAILGLSKASSYVTWEGLVNSYFYYSKYYGLNVSPKVHILEAISNVTVSIGVTFKMLGHEGSALMNGLMSLLLG